MRAHKGARQSPMRVEEHWGVSADQVGNKSTVRANLRAARKQRDVATLAEIDLRISRHICDLLESIPVTAESVIAAYVAMPFEPAINELRVHLRQLGSTVLIPIVNGNDLLWAADAEEGSWSRNSFGTLEPDACGARTSSHALSGCAAIIVPAQAVDASGFRLGQGKGFYDRALAEISGLEHSPLLIGVTYESEFLPEVPTETHDIPVDVSVTESTVRWFNTPD